MFYAGDEIEGWPEEVYDPDDLAELHWLDRAIDEVDHQGGLL